MDFNLFFNAMFRFRNLSILLFWVGIVSLLSGGQYLDSTTQITIGYGTGAVVYVALVIQSLFSESYKEKVKVQSKKSEINTLNRECIRWASKLKNISAPIQKQKLKKILQDKNDILKSINRSEDYSYLKGVIVEKSLNLVVSYIKLLINYSIRSKELSEINISDLMNKINVNRRKINFMKDQRMIEDINAIIEMDESTIHRVKEERNELERINARLDYIESMIGMFKHQIISSIESEEMVEKLETAVNEATALDNVLQERRKNRIRM